MISRTKRFHNFHSKWSNQTKVVRTLLQAAVSASARELREAWSFMRATSNRVHVILPPGTRHASLKESWNKLFYELILLGAAVAAANGLRQRIIGIKVCAIDPRCPKGVLVKCVAPCESVHHYIVNYATDLDSKDCVAVGFGLLAWP